MRAKTLARIEGDGVDTGQGQDRADVSESVARVLAHELSYGIL